jgi:hypothetical protein
MEPDMRHRWQSAAILAAGVVLAAGCAAPKPANDEPPEDLVYRTGSHIPVRDSAAARSTSDKSMVDDMRRNSGLTNTVQGTSGR